MSKVYRTSRGEGLDIDMLCLANENTIAIGNMRTNARGDELGPGGKIVRTRAQVMQDYHKLNSAMIEDDRAPAPAPQAKPVKTGRAVATPMVEHAPTAPLPPAGGYNQPRGALASSIADSVAKDTEVNQELMDLEAFRNSNAGNPGGGINRI